MLGSFPLWPVALLVLPIANAVVTSSGDSGPAQASRVVMRRESIGISKEEVDEQLMGADEPRQKGRDKPGQKAAAADAAFAKRIKTKSHSKKAIHVTAPKLKKVDAPKLKKAGVAKAAFAKRIKTKSQSKKAIHVTAPKLKEADATDGWLKRLKDQQKDRQQAQEAERERQQQVEKYAKEQLQTKAEKAAIAKVKEDKKKAAEAAAQVKKDRKFFAIVGCPTFKPSDRLKGLGRVLPEPTQTALETMTHRVVCCNESVDETEKMYAVKGWAVPIADTDADPCIGSSPDAPVQNNPYKVGVEEIGKTWQEAHDHCDDKGLRLCTFPEIMAGRACDRTENGIKANERSNMKFDFCDFNTNLVWTATEGPCQETEISFSQGAECVLPNGDEAFREQVGPTGTLINETIRETSICCDNKGIAAGHKWKLPTSR